MLAWIWYRLNKLDLSFASHSFARGDFGENNKKSFCYEIMIVFFLPELKHKRILANLMLASVVNCCWMEKVTRAIEILFLSCYKYKWGVSWRCQCCEIILKLRDSWVGLFSFLSEHWEVLDSGASLIKWSTIYSSLQYRLLVQLKSKQKIWTSR